MNQNLPELLEYKSFSSSSATARQLILVAQAEARTIVEGARRESEAILKNAARIAEQEIAQIVAERSCSQIKLWRDALSRAKEDLVELSIILAEEIIEEQITANPQWLKKKILRATELLGGKLKVVITASPLLHTLLIQMLPQFMPEASLYCDEGLEPGGFTIESGSLALRQTPSESLSQFAARLQGSSFRSLVRQCR